MNPTLEKEWRRQVIARAQGRCEKCGAPGKVTDHVVPVAEGGALYDPSNGQLLCTLHDDEKTRQDLSRMARNRKAKRTVKFQ